MFAEPLLILEPLPGMAATNKCLAQSNKSRTRGEALMSGQIWEPGLIGHGARSCAITQRSYPMKKFLAASSVQADGVGHLTYERRLWGAQSSNPSDASVNTNSRRAHQ